MHLLGSPFTERWRMFGRAYVQQEMEWKMWETRLGDTGRRGWRRLGVGHHRCLWCSVTKLENMKWAHSNIFTLKFCFTWCCIRFLFFVSPSLSSFGVLGWTVAVTARLIVMNAWKMSAALWLFSVCFPTAFVRPTFAVGNTNKQFMKQ